MWRPRGRDGHVGSGTKLAVGRDSLRQSQVMAPSPHARMCVPGTSLVHFLQDFNTSTYASSIAGSGLVVVDLAQSTSEAHQHSVVVIAVSPSPSSRVAHVVFWIIGRPATTKASSRGLRIPTIVTFWWFIVSTLGVR